MSKIKFKEIGLSKLTTQLLPPIKGFIETSFIDWRNRIAAVLFLPNCNLACPYCHNYILITDPNKLATLSIEIILYRLLSFKKWIDGIVISGGEPTIHPTLPLLLKIIKKLGFRTKLDTNGLQPNMLKYLIKHNLLDAIAMDLKAPLTQSAYQQVTGQSVNLVNLIKSIHLIIESKIEYEFRSTIWPNWHGIIELKTMSKILKNAKVWTLQAMNPTTAWKPKIIGKGTPYNENEIQLLQQRLVNKIVTLNN